MSQRAKHNTAIEWTHQPGTKGETLNPIRARNRETGKRGWFCVHANGDCINCYAEGLNVKPGDSGGNGISYKAQLRDQVDIYLDEATLQKPLHWREPRTIFLCSMTDVFGDWVEDAWLDRIFAVAALCPQHRFIVLTKRSRRMRTYFLGPYPDGNGVMARIADATFEFAPKLPVGTPLHERPIGPRLENGEPEFGWRRFLNIGPLPNVWLGVSCGDQDGADEFIPDLLATPAAVRFLSCEPLRGPIDLTQVTHRSGEHSFEIASVLEGDDGFGLNRRRNRIDWVIAGGESGPKARPMHPDWARGLRDQCAAAGVPFFFKQWGEWAPGENADKAQTRTERTADWDGDHWLFSELTAAQSAETHRDDEPTLFRLGVRAAGSHLDGDEHKAFPQVAP